MDLTDFVSRSNAEYIERLHEQYQRDPRSLPANWQGFFAGFEAGSAGAAASRAAIAMEDQRAGSDRPMAVEVADLVHSYRELGHFVANLDPLGHNRTSHPLLQLSQFGLSPADLDRTVGHAGFMGPTDGTLRDLIDKLRLTYCSTIGVEYMSISDKAQREWLQRRMEPAYNRPSLSADDQKWILQQLVNAQGLEEFLHTRYVGAKRFSLEGGEAFIPLLNTIIEEGAVLGVEQFVTGMAHRGRLNTLCNVLNKPLEQILEEFEGGRVPAEFEGDGDVKYHLGYSTERIARNGRKYRVALAYNPSHLELVNPVVVGIVRAKQYAMGDTNRTRVVPILIHGDAAFTGQGIVHETLGLSELPFWRTGGTIHIIINNQIGFTTLPRAGRFTPYPTDVAKMIQAPIFHVNGDDPEAVIHAAKLAMAFRQAFHCDVMIDLWCYRRHGHNEVDDPTYTQPLMYQQIGQHPTPREIYTRRLVEQQVITEADAQAMQEAARRRLDAAQKTAKEMPPRTPEQLKGLWEGMQRSTKAEREVRTQVSPEFLRDTGMRVTTIPPGFTVNPKLTRLIAARRDMSMGKAPVDWGCAESLALGTLLLEGTPIRFVGQDAQRGTFSHRQARLHDHKTGEKYIPLANLDPNQAPIIIVNTMLSELAVLGFEYGFSSADPRNLVIWEAQFGDFVNGAQPIIDQFIVAAESKWQKMCGLVMLLPHGYEGQGPEHSSGYVERFLQLCAEDNIQVVQPSTPAQYFHVLRRQMLRKFRKPLVLFMPKSLLRDERSASRLTEFTDAGFQLVLDDPRSPDPRQVNRLILCTGKVYYTLDSARLARELPNIAIVRVEQLYPFPARDLSALLAKYRNAGEIVWAQDEPRNRGGWMYMRDKLDGMLGDDQHLSYVGRGEAASPATGSLKLHQIEEQEIIRQAMDVPAAAAAAAPSSSMAPAISRGPLA